ncbi:MAG: hypothetical protein HC879_02025 [Leptolyngbyaceae cyanobacterium SL_5_9]|nr:hypothetical protein [Leptolyngbyaceae cyanobacterium SL_5_9]NJO73857.1 hypothetical protein [Leptolyngbyaceae cyanobacterium RM1_406_9]
MTIPNTLISRSIWRLLRWQAAISMYHQEGAEVTSRGAVDSAVMEYMSRAMQG